MSGPLAIGVGCRAACQAAALVALVDRAVAGLDRTGAQLFTLAAKAGDANVREAARDLGLPLIGLPAEVLATAAGVTVRSARVQAATGVPSVAEAAALVGAGRGARLLVPRMAEGGATCAVAAGEGRGP